MSTKKRKIHNPHNVTNDQLLMHGPITLVVNGVRRPSRKWRLLFTDEIKTRQPNDEIEGWSNILDDWVQCLSGDSNDITYRTSLTRKELNAIK